MADWEKTNRTCPLCGVTGTVKLAVVEDDYGHEDDHYKCSNCLASWWVDGIDS